MPTSVAGSARETDPIARVPRGRRPLTPGQQALAARYLPLARSLARPYQKSWPDSRDEFESAAALALVQAAESYDPARGVPFATFSRHRIAGALRDVLRRRGAAHLTSRYDSGSEAAGPIRWAEWLEDHGQVVGSEPDPPVDRDLERAEEVERQLRRVPPKHAAALRRIYLHGETPARAAAVLDLSASRVATLHRQALAMLRGT